VKTRLLRTVDSEPNLEHRIRRSLRSDVPRVPGWLESDEHVVDGAVSVDYHLDASGVFHRDVTRRDDEDDLVPSSELHRPLTNEGDWPGESRVRCRTTRIARTRSGASNVVQYIDRERSIGFELDTQGRAKGSTLPELKKEESSTRGWKLRVECQSEREADLMRLTELEHRPRSLVAAQKIDDDLVHPRGGEVRGRHDDLEPAPDSPFTTRECRR